MRIFIDFEAISAPMCWVAGVPMDMPYAYSMMEVDTDNKRTFIVDFKNVNKNNVHNAIRKDIVDTLTLWNGNKPIDIMDVQFISWYGSLETKILSSLFTKYRLEDQMQVHNMFSASLERMSFDFRNDYDFQYCLSIVPKSVKRKFNFTKRRKDFKIINGEHVLGSGVLASITGSFLYMKYNNQFAMKKYDVKEFDEEKVKAEIAHYSLDDVLRMQYIHERPELMKRRFEVMYQGNKKVQESTKYKSLLIGVKQFIDTWHFKDLADARNKILKAIEEAKNPQIDPGIMEMNQEFIDSLDFMNSTEESIRLEKLLKRFDKYREKFKVVDITTRDELRRGIEMALKDIENSKEKLKDDNEKELAKIV